MITSHNSINPKCCVCGREFSGNWNGRNMLAHLERHVRAGEAAKVMILTLQGDFSHYQFRKVEKPPAL